ncbi:MAG: EVE domain-containing protein, partial [Chloroflexi bacterium]|nr:EVE domain-containing protein [Chloroflexota bacterium]
MPGSHWLVTLTPENYAITRSMNFTFLGLRARQRKKAERVAAGDRVVYYVLEQRRFPATSTVTSAYFEDRHPIWINRERRDDPFPYRVHTQSNLVLQPGEGLDAEAIAPRLLYLKRWP